MIKAISRKGAIRTLCLLLALALLCAGLPTALSASAATTPSSLGLAQHGMDAYRDGWVYSSGAKGQSYGGTRASDCAGLIYAYFSDCGSASGLGGGATSQVNLNCVFSNDISEGIPRIHGLVLTMPDYYSPGTGIYGHIGIYIGNNEACDNSDYTYNMRWEPVVGGGRNWTAWHVMDNGMLYPVNGWYLLDGKMVHYTNFEYDVNTTIDGYVIGADGYAIGTPDSSLLSKQWVSASQVAAYLGTRYSGTDSTYALIYGLVQPQQPDPVELPDGYNGQITGDGVNLRSAATTQSRAVTQLNQGTLVNVATTVTGESVTAKGQTSDQWYQVTTAGGASGYVSSLFVAYSPTQTVAGSGTPVITAAGGYVTITTEWRGADIYYTTDGTEPTTQSSVYTAPLYLPGYTYKAMAAYAGKSSPVTTATVLSDSTVFTDLTTKDWFYTAVDYAVGKGLFVGAGDGLFKPNDVMTRGMFVTVLGNLAGVVKSQWTGSRFTDVKETKYYAPYVAWASEYGLVSGTSATTFSPDAPITREQIAVILYNFAKRTANDTSFSADRFNAFVDGAMASSFAKEALQWAADKQVLSGASGALSPKAVATRAQVAQIFKSCQTALANTAIIAEPATVPEASEDIITF